VSFQAPPAARVPQEMALLGVLDRALTDTEAALGLTMRKSRFWENHAGETFNARHRLMLNRLLDGFRGNLTSSKRAQIATCSQDSAARDIEALIVMGILAKGPAGGRSTTYVLKDEPRGG
jgi:Fic family protein